MNWYPGARESFNDMGAIVLGSTKQDRYPIERRAFLRQPKDAARDLDALASLAWCREDVDRRVLLGRLGSTRLVEEVELQPAQRVGLV